MMRREAVILVAEDDDGHFSLIEKNLLRAGFTHQVCRFTDGQETIDFVNQLKDPSFLHSNHPCLLLLDIRMPKVDGLQILKYMKNDPALRKIPVIVFTAAGHPEVIEQCRGLGCSLFIAKPVESEQFVETMNRIGHFLSIVELPAVLS